MTLKGLLETSWFMKVVLVLWLVSGVFVLFLLGRIDQIVHGDLYGFGLQFSYVWAAPYWVLLRLAYVYLAVPSVLSVVVLGLDVWKRFRSENRVSRRSMVKPVGVKTQPLKENSMVISCPSCNKTFRKPLVMLDFGSGKTKLVNTCPYCNATLGEEHIKEDEKDIETRVLGPDEKVKMNDRRRR
jgi:uncharacterized Zn-finger protein